ncbi:MAG: peptide-methionine (S)-S-oxide reductase [Patescibacteria group bacterium]|nr:peptide-methionine (S)-S-oxide reductase [Patescibacteria group bacterium]
MKIEVATFAGGCFWCTEAIFKRLKGVIKVLPGYTGGATENPTYKSVSSGKSGHAECIQIEFDSEVITFQKLLDVFLHTHNPTTLNRQGHDIGTQYRSAIFYHSEAQKEIAESSINKLEVENLYEDPIVTKIVPFQKFYEAEDYHKNYFEKNRNAPYCNAVIEPKLQKFLKDFRVVVV